MGVPAARGHGVMEVQSFEAAAGALVAAQYPEHQVILPARSYAVDRTPGPFRAGTKVPLWIRKLFAALSRSPLKPVPNQTQSIFIAWACGALAPANGLRHCRSRIGRPS